MSNHPDSQEAPLDHDMRLSFGGNLEDFEVGDTFHHWPGKTITESDNNLFCLLTMNHHPVHLDQRFAADHQHGKVLVVGTLVFSLVVGMTVPAISGAAIANLGYESVTHTAPVFIGDTIHAMTEILGVRRSSTKADRGVIHVRTAATNQDGDTVLVFERSVLIPAGSINRGA